MKLLKNITKLFFYLFFLFIFLEFLSIKLFSEYSKTIPSEDMAEVFSHLMIYKNEIHLNDDILNKKINFIRKILFEIDSNFKF